MIRTFQEKHGNGFILYCGGFMIIFFYGYRGSESDGGN